jgi:MOSC domain-containing protein YiiM
MEGFVVFVGSNPSHSMEKPARSLIRLLEGLGIEQDAHLGKTVKHRSRVARDPSQPNLRQVHLIHSELHDELAEKGFSISPCKMGENITTRGIDLLGLPTGARLKIGEQAIVEITGLRNPCAQLDGIQKGLMAATLEKGLDGELIRKVGVMCIVISGGDVKSGDKIEVQLPPSPYIKLKPV